MIFIKKIYFVVPVVAMLTLLEACDVSKSVSPFPPTTACIATTTISYDDTICPITGGCTLSFTCETILKSTQNSNVWSKMTDNLTAVFQTPVRESMNISSITINQPALLQASAGDAPTNWYNNTVDCTEDGNSVTCSTFLPIASDFTIQGTLGTKNLTLNVTVNNALTPSSTTECGQQGTTVQRMFDCSMRVENFAGFGTGTGVAPGFTSFVPGNPDPNWFLVSCPGTDNQQCFWLSPVMSTTQSSINGVHTAYPALAADEYDSSSPSPGTPMSSYNGGRFLWSGRSINGPYKNGTYNFFQANGNNPYDVATPYYNFYSSSPRTESVMATLNGGTPPNQGPIIYRPQKGDNPPSPIINTYDSAAYNLATSAQSVCQIGADPVLLGGTTYKWQMPSYPMIMTLTGGYSQSALRNNANCEPGGFGYWQDAKAFCNIGSGPSAQGFRAIDPVPGFDSSAFSISSRFWSSSVFSSNYGAWIFDGGYNIPPVGHFPLPGYSGSIYVYFPALRNFVRCVSAVW